MDVCSYLKGTDPEWKWCFPLSSGNNRKACHPYKIYPESNPSPYPLSSYFSGPGHHHLSLVYCSVSQLASLLPPLSYPPLWFHLPSLSSSFPPPTHNEPCPTPNTPSISPPQGLCTCWSTSQKNLSLHTHRAQFLSSPAQLPPLWRDLFQLPSWNSIPVLLLLFTLLYSFLNIYYILVHIYLVIVFWYFPLPSPIPKQVGSSMRVKPLCMHICVYFKLLPLVLRLHDFCWSISSSQIFLSHLCPATESIWQVFISVIVFFSSGFPICMVLLYTFYFFAEPFYFNMFQDYLWLPVQAFL